MDQLMSDRFRLFRKLGCQKKIKFFSDYHVKKTAEIGAYCYLPIHRNEHNRVFE